MASDRNAVFTMQVRASSAKGAKNKAERIVKMSRVKKVHAYQIIRLAVPNTFMVDIILKESITHKTSKHEPVDVGTVITAKVNCPHPNCIGTTSH